jgi:hypothetical protein
MCGMSPHMKMWREGMRFVHEAQPSREGERLEAVEGRHGGEGPKDPDLSIRWEASRGGLRENSRPRQYEKDLLGQVRTWLRLGKVTETINRGDGGDSGVLKRPSC